MANLNDFKLVNLKSKKMFRFLNVKEEYSDTEKSRLGFYHLVLENITGEREVERVKDLIIDTDYNKKICFKSVDDLGMDAVNIIGDEESDEVTIQLFNFKYRETFNLNKTKEESSLTKSTKYLEYILDEAEAIKQLSNDKVRESLLKINSLLNSNAMCNIILYMISNEANGFNRSSNHYIELLEKNYGMKIQVISLDDIIGFLIPSRSTKESKFVVGSEDFLSFQKDDLSTQKSYVVKMSLVDLVRITSDDDELGEFYNLEDDNAIANSRLDFALLYDNVRGYLGQTDYNANIVKTLKNNYREFFMLNNGLTFTATGIDVDVINSGKRYLFTINNFQIVNGGQTIRSIYNFLTEMESVNDVRKMRETYILVRIFKIAPDDELKNRIAEYTNSQNAISSSDLKSVDKIQIQIENYLKEEKILYIRKAGQLGEDDIDYDYRISKEKMAQIIYSVFGYPDRASNQKKRLFQEYYNDIFKGERFLLEKTVEYCKLYYEVEEKYNTLSSKYNYFELKNYYVIFLISNYHVDIKKAIEILEETIVDNSSQVAPSRLLLKNRFKGNLEEKMKNIQ